MNKSELIKVVAKKAGFTQGDTELILRITLNEIKSALAGGENEVSLPHFGKFVVVERAARTGRNPQTGAAVPIKAHNVPKFKAAKEFKEAVL